MSTRGWYELYVVDEASSRMELAMQFYKWGDATPGNALYELNRFEALFDVLQGCVPVDLVDQLLEFSVGAARAHLPRAFSLGYYLFLLLRADDDTSSPWRAWEWADLPKEERPDYQLGYQVGLESVRQGVKLAANLHPVLDRAHFSLAVGRLVHTWRKHQHEMNFLKWLHWITMISDKRVDFGHIAGDYRQAWDIAYLYRFFVHVPRLDGAQQIEAITLQLCEANGDELDAARGRADEDALDEWEIEQAREHAKILSRLGDRREALDVLRRTYDLVPSPLWLGEVPRGDYLGP